MRKNIRAIFVISALVALVLCSACVLPSFGEQKKQEGGLTQVTVQAASSRISFEEAYQNLKDYRMDSSSVSAENKRIYYILGRDVDDSGNAMSWVFGVNYGMGDRLLIYEKSGWTVFPNSKSTLPSEEIPIDRIVSPGNMITTNKAIIAKTLASTIPDRKDLELQEGIYKLNVYSGNSGKVIMFNATSGALITQ
jgi:hypothetical protein